MECVQIRYRLGYNINIGYNYSVLIQNNCMGKKSETRVVHKRACSIHKLIIFLSSRAFFFFITVFLVCFIYHKCLSTDFYLHMSLNSLRLYKNVWEKETSGYHFLCRYSQRSCYIFANKQIHSFAISNGYLKSRSPRSMVCYSIF